MLSHIHSWEQYSGKRGLQSRDWGEEDGFWEMMKDTEVRERIRAGAAGRRGLCCSQKRKTERIDVRTGAGHGTGYRPRSRGVERGPRLRGVEGLQQRLRGVGERRTGKRGVGGPGPELSGVGGLGARMRGVGERWAGPDAAKGSIGKSNAT